MRSGLPTVYYGYMDGILLVFWVNCNYLKFLWLLYFHDYSFYDMRVIYICAQWYVVKQSQVIRFLIMMSVEFLSTSFILVGLW